MINIKHRAIHKSIRRLGFEVLAELCMRNGKEIWLKQRQLWNIRSNVVVDCLIVNSAQQVLFVTVCVMTQQQAEQLCRRVQSTSYQLKHWLLTIIVVYKHSCLATYISAAAVGQALLGCQSTTIRRCETQDLHLGTSVQCVVLIFTVNILCPVCLLFSRGYIHNIATKFEENDMKNKVCGR